MGRTRKKRHDLPRRMYFHHGAYYFRPKTGKAVWLGRELHVALAQYASIVEPVKEFRVMADVIDGYIREIAPKKAPRTYQDNLVEAGLLKRAFGQMRPGDIRPKDLYAYRRAREAPVRANREISLLSSVFAYAIESGVVDENPCRQVRRATETPRARYVEHWERRKFANKKLAPKWLRAYVLLKYLTGLRQADMLALGLPNITPKGLEVRTGKTKKRLLFRWTWALRTVVDSILAIPRPQSSLYCSIPDSATRSADQGSKSRGNGQCRNMLQLVTSDSGNTTSGRKRHPIPRHWQQPKNV